MLDRIERDLRFEGPLSAEQHPRLLKNCEQELGTRPAYFGSQHSNPTRVIPGLALGLS